MTAPDPSPDARRYGLAAARALLRGRKGHGGGPCHARRLTEAELVALCALAFEAGRDHERGAAPSPSSA